MRNLPCYDFEKISQIKFLVEELISQFYVYRMRKLSYRRDFNLLDAYLRETARDRFINGI